jgi:23S rRNA (pseudouridine1915-N3)-methyltransferase
MQVHIIAVGKIKEKYLQLGISDYEKRLCPYVKLQITEISEEKRPADVSPAVESVAKAKEGQRIIDVIPESSYVIALDVQGKTWSSEELADSFRQWELAGKNNLTFVIGGDLGLSPGVLSGSDMRLSLSKMTFTHPMARILLLEQIYRAFRILRGEPYHK